MEFPKLQPKFTRGRVAFCLICLLLAGVIMIPSVSRLIDTNACVRRATAEIRDVRRERDPTVLDALTAAGHFASSAPVAEACEAELRQRFFFLPVQTHH